MSVTNKVLYFVGNVQYGQCGLFIDENKSELFSVTLPTSRYKQISCGGKHVAMIGLWKQ